MAGPLKPGPAIGMFCCSLVLALSGSPLFAQAVQLPAVRSFGTTGAVSVPDRGGALMGGNATSRSSSTTSGIGPLSSRATGQQAGASSMSVHATIIDLDAMDEAILSRVSDKANGKTSGSIQSNFRPNSYGTAIANTLNPTRYSQQVLPRSSRGANDWQLAMAGATQIVVEDPNPALAKDNNGVRFYMQHAADAQSVGRLAAARVYFRMAFDLLTPDQRERFNTLVEERKLEALPANKRPVTEEKPAAAPVVTTPTTPAAPETPVQNSASPFDTPATGSDPNASPF